MIDTAHNTYTPDEYNRIAKAIAFMRQHHLEQPNLQAIAHHVHLSEHHFQRLFTAWAGISPKRFAQYLTVEYAKSKITTTKNLLDLTLETGLSSPGRLHDLFVTLEALSPGECKSGGRGLHIGYGIHETPFGPCVVATTTRGICNLAFLNEANQDIAEQHLKTEWPNAEIIYNPANTEDVCDRLFQPLTASQSALSLHLKGTNFQVQVWRSLLRIPFAELTTYQGLANTIGKPTAARAIGNAVGRNPIAYLIPCHRVIRQSGELGGYRWGVDRKTALLGWEASQSQRETEQNAPVFINASE